MYVIVMVANERDELCKMCGQKPYLSAGPRSMDQILNFSTLAACSHSESSFNAFWAII